MARCASSGDGSTGGRQQRSLTMARLATRPVGEAVAAAVVGGGALAVDGGRGTTLACRGTGFHARIDIHGSQPRSTAGCEHHRRGSCGQWGLDDQRGANNREWIGVDPVDDGVDLAPTEPVGLGDGDEDECDARSTPMRRESPNSEAPDLARKVAVDRLHMG
ncbi:hypothetical protein GUJ93_ZPchr0007g4043 [Zizania palustris]|uniref:Uncharacterized protein n=1 Tax=Zizania palustris TaxID=103762 RepID=A0A8J5SNJ2_ZIZPA|nr:hypothetical protein GUJ93_ZPchr0007g4043 [Zizania palustris]